MANNFQKKLELLYTNQVYDTKYLMGSTERNILVLSANFFFQEGIRMFPFSCIGRCTALNLIEN